MRDSVRAADRGGPHHRSTFYTDINSVAHFEVHYFRDFYGNMRGSFMFRFPSYINHHTVISLEPALNFLRYVFASSRMSNTWLLSEHEKCLVHYLILYSLTDCVWFDIATRDSTLEDEGTTALRKAGHHKSATLCLPKRSVWSGTPLWEPKIWRELGSSVYSCVSSW